MKLEDAERIAINVMSNSIDTAVHQFTVREAFRATLSELRRLQDRERWIPMEESKPQDDDMVDVRGTGFDGNGYGVWLTMTHWRPLPDAAAIAGAGED